MLKIKPERAGTALVLKLEGEIDETFDLTKLLPGYPPEMQVNCRGVNRINSVGVKAWIGYFQKVPPVVKLSFTECSPAIVEQFNLIKNFKCSGEVISICVPFMCKKCAKNVINVFEVKALQASKCALPPVKCPCGGEAEFDDIPEEFFGFIST